MTSQEKITRTYNKIRSPKISICNSIIFRTGILAHCLYKENKYKKKDIFQQNTVGFLAATYSENTNITERVGRKILRN